MSLTSLMSGTLGLQQGRIASANRKICQRVAHAKGSPRVRYGKVSLGLLVSSPCTGSHPTADIWKVPLMPLEPDDGT